MKSLFIIFCVFTVIANAQNFDYGDDNEDDDDSGEELVDDNLGKRIEIHGNRFHEYYDTPLVIPEGLEDRFGVNEVRPAKSSEEFSYDPKGEFGPENWYKISPNCSGSNQSPIDINRSTVRLTYQPVPKLRITKWKETPATTEIVNAGHTVKIRFTYKNEKRPSLSFGPLPGSSQYHLHELHYHFGLSSYSGAEHLINGQSYAAESHLVFYNRKYGSFQNAISYPDGLTVFARLYEASDYNYEEFPYINYLRYIQNINASIVFTVNTFSLKSVLGAWGFDYFSYKGSLTTPPCAESVTWIIADEPIKISNEQLQQFRNLKQNNGNTMAPNFRPIQRLNKRLVNYLNT